MDTGTLRLALDEANLGLREVSQQFDKLSKRKQQLENVVASLTSLLNVLPTPISLTERDDDSGEDEVKDASMPLWMLARDVLAERRVAMSVPAISTALFAKGYKVKGDGLRVAILRRPKVFQKVAYGMYGLVEWSAERKPEGTSTLELEVA